MERLTRKIDKKLLQWKASPDRFPLIVKGARQVGKTEAIEYFAHRNYDHIIEINFALQKEYLHIFDDGFSVDKILQNITLINPALEAVPGNTLLFFDELQACPNCATSLKAFKLDGRYDVICSGSLMGINYHEIEANSVGYKEDYTLYSLDFEEYLWAKGYKPVQMQEFFSHIAKGIPLSALQLQVLQENFQEYMILGGMPAVVWHFISQRNYSGTLRLQQQLLADYEEDITKYAGGLDKGKILNVYRKIPVFLGKENKKFQITKVAHGARSREYLGVVDWLADAGIVNVCYCLEHPELPLKGNYNPEQYKLYFGDTGLLIASLDEEAQSDLRRNRNFGTYKGGLYENMAAQMLVQQGYAPYYYRNPQGTLEMDFFIRDEDSLIPVEVKAVDGTTKSLSRLIEDNEHYPDIHYGIKLGQKNIGWNGKFYTIPFSLAFLLKRWVQARMGINTDF